MTQKDLRLKYHCQVKDSPFDEQLQIYIDGWNHNDVIAYIEYLEDKILEMKEGLRLIGLLLEEESKAKEELDTRIKDESIQ